MLFDGIAFKIYKSKDYGKSMIWVPKLMLSSIFLWPNKNKRITMLVSYFFFASSLISIIIGNIYYIKANYNDFNKAALGSCLLIHPIGAGIKLTQLCYKRNELEDLLKNMDEHFWPYDLMDNCTQSVLKKLYMYIVLYMVGFFSLAGTYAMLQFLLPIFSAEKVLPLPSDLPIDWKDSPTFELLYLTHIIGLCAVWFIVLGSDFLVISVCEATAIQYRILQKCFLAFNTNEMIVINNKLRRMNRGFYEYSDIRREYFVRIIKHHQFMFRFTKALIKAFNPIELGQLMISETAICLGIFIATAPKTTVYIFISTVIYIIGYVSQVGIKCFIGTDLNGQAELLASYVFNSNWEKLHDTKFLKDILYVLQQSQRYNEYAAYSLFPLNMEFFVKILKLAFSLYTLLKTFSK